MTGVDRPRKRVFAHMVPKKGHDPHAIKMLGREIGLSGYSRMILKSDQEPSIKELADAVKRARERSEKVEIMPEESPVGEHKNNGEVERAIQTIQGQMWTMRLAWQSRYKAKIRTDHTIMAWMVKHAAL